MSTPGSNKFSFSGKILFFVSLAGIKLLSSNLIALVGNVNVSEKFHECRRYALYDICWVKRKSVSVVGSQSRLQIVHEIRL